MVDYAFHLLYKMVDNDILPDVATYNSMFHCLCDVDRFGDVRVFLVEMVDSNISLDVFTFSILIDAHCKKVKVEVVCSHFMSFPRRVLGVACSFVSFV